MGFARGVGRFRRDEREVGGGVEVEIEDLPVGTDLLVEESVVGDDVFCFEFAEAVFWACGAFDDEDGTARIGVDDAFWRADDEVVDAVAVEVGPLNFCAEVCVGFAGE